MGKSGLSVAAALRLSAASAEIINADSMQVYKGCPILTNKVSTTEQRGIKHHLMGFRNITQFYDTIEYDTDARACIDSLHQRGVLPIICGGTNYYLHSLLLRDSTLGQPTDDQSEHPLLKESTERLYEELQKVDPSMAAQWHPRDRRKIQRSLEIYLTTGVTASEHYRMQREQPLKTRYDSLIFWVHLDLATLDARLDQRVEQMMREGMLDDVEYLSRIADESEEPLNLSDGVWQSIGYRHLLPYIKHKSPNTLDNCVASLKAANRQYARKQINFIRNRLLPHCYQAGAKIYLVSPDDDELVASIIDNFLQEKECIDPLKVPSLSDDQRELLESSTTNWVREDRTRYQCDLCQIRGAFYVTFGHDRWEEHLKSKRHRKSLRAQSGTFCGSTLG